MATNDKTGTSKLPSFSTIKESEKRAVILKSEGKTMDQVTAHINNEFALDYAVITVRQWFFAGGKLEQAYSDYNEATAVLALKEARQIIKKATKVAAAVLTRHLNSMDEKIQQGAAKSLLNKYVPDKQISLDSTWEEESIPDELASVADALKEDNIDGPEPVDEPPVGEPDSPEAGA